VTIISLPGWALNLGQGEKGYESDHAAKPRPSQPDFSVQVEAHFFSVKAGLRLQVACGVARYPSS
jgi:hypothetical protein